MCPDPSPSSTPHPSNPSAIGRVYLVGAGPGDPGLLTLRGCECLARADAVLYDYLVNPRILDFAAPGAERICLGQHGRSRLWTQAEINARMVDLARVGQTVVRLKGGDPAVFARSAEELDWLARHQIPYEVVPGITAALAASSYAGIPLTHRDAASAVAFVTGHEDADKLDSALDFDALARFPGTLVFYMAVTTVRHWSAALLRAGKPPQTPAAIVRRCSLPDQRIVRCTLATLVDELEPSTRLRPPAIVIVGEAVGESTVGSWFTSRPLFGSRVLVTRPNDQVGELRRPLEELGAEVLVQPAIRIDPPSDAGPVDAILHRLSEFDWIVFSSVNGVRHFCQRLLATGRDIRALGGLSIAAIGPGTAEALREFSLRADRVPAEFRAESLAAELAPTAAGKRFLLIRASRGREVLAETLLAAGAQVEQVVAYSSRDIEAPAPEFLQAMVEGRITWTTVTSSAIARSLAHLFGDALHQTRLASISPVTSATLREFGLSPAVEATTYTMDGLVAAIVAARHR